MRQVFFVLALLTSFTGCEEYKEVSLLLPGDSKLCFFGDGGEGGKEQKRVAKLLIEEDCGANFYLGDIVYPKGIKSADDPKLGPLFLDQYGPLYQKNHLFLMMGNHDYHGNVDAWLRVALRYPRLHYPSHYYLARINDLCFPVLNTTDYKFGQVAWLRSLNLKECRAVILLGHHPAKSSGKHKKPYFPLNLFLDYAITYGDIYVAGHDHQLSYEGVYKGIHQFVSGASGAELRKVDQSLPVWGKSRNGYLTMEEGNKELVFVFWGVGPDGAKTKLYTKKIPFSSLANE